TVIINQDQVLDHFLPSLQVSDYLISQQVLHIGKLGVYNYILQDMNQMKRCQHNHCLGTNLHQLSSKSILNYLVDVHLSTDHTLSATTFLQDLVLLLPTKTIHLQLHVVVAKVLVHLHLVVSLTLPRWHQYHEGLIYNPLILGDSSHTQYQK